MIPEGHVNRQFGIDQRLDDFRQLIVIGAKAHVEGTIAVDEDSREVVFLSENFRNNLL